MPMSTPQNYRCQCLCPHSEPQTPTSTGDPLVSAGRFGPGSYEVTAFFLYPALHETLSTLSKSLVSVSPSPVEFL